MLSSRLAAVAQDSSQLISTHLRVLACLSGLCPLHVQHYLHFHLFSGLPTNTKIRIAFWDLFELPPGVICHEYFISALRIHAGPQEIAVPEADFLKNTRGVLKLARKPGVPNTTCMWHCEGPVASPISMLGHLEPHGGFVSCDCGSNFKI